MIGLLRDRTERPCWCGVVVVAEQIRIFQKIHGQTKHADLYVFDPHRGPCGLQCAHSEPVPGWKQSDGVCTAEHCKRCHPLPVPVAP